MTERELKTLEGLLDRLCEAHVHWAGKIAKTRAVLGDLCDLIQKLQRLEAFQTELLPEEKHPIDGLEVPQELHTYKDYAEKIGNLIYAIPQHSVPRKTTKLAIESLARKSESAREFMKTPFEKEELRGKIERLLSIYYQTALRTGSPAQAAEWAYTMVYGRSPHVTNFHVRDSHVDRSILGDGGLYVESPPMRLMDRIAQLWRGQTPRPRRSRTRNPWET